MESLDFILTRIEIMNPMRRVRGPGLQAVGPVPSPGWFMESEHLPNADVSWGHEPLGIPLNRPSGTFSPTGGEGWDEGVRFMGRSRRAHFGEPAFQD
jgi:hypothetical protein